MTRRARRAAWGVGIVVAVFMSTRSRFDGLSLLVVLCCGIGVVSLLGAISWASQPTQCPHCQNQLRGYTDPAKHRGDGI